MTRSTERNTLLADVIITAVEGGTGYWAAVSGYKWSDEAPETTRATLHELNEDGTDYDGDQHVLTVDAIATGLGRIRRGEVAVNSMVRESITLADRENDAGYIDADGADVITQAALLNEIRYG